MIQRRLLGILAAPLLLTGCIATQRDVLQLENQSDELKRQIMELDKTISSLQANQADLALNMKQLQQHLGAFSETVKESQQSMTLLSSKLDDLGMKISSQVSDLGESLSAQQAKTLAEQKAALAAARQATTPSELFRNAEVRLSKKNYSLAAKGFEEYVAKFPQGALIDVAVFHLGEAYFGLGQWEEAGRQFATVLEKYPKSDFTASARLMYARCLMKLKKNLSEARQYLESIETDFPNSPEAKAAQPYLKKLESSDKGR